MEEVGGLSCLRTIVGDLRHPRDRESGGACRRYPMTLRNVWKFIRNNLNERAQRNLIEESSDVMRFHPDAPVTGRPADISFFGCSVNVNAATEGMRILPLQSTKPNDAGNNRVTAGGVRL